MVFENISCEAASPLKPIQQPGSDDVMIDTSMFVFYTSALLEIDTLANRSCICFCSDLWLRFCIRADRVRSFWRSVVGCKRKLVGGLEHFFFSIIYGIILPID